jgi:hypothetical protein
MDAPASYIFKLASGAERVEKFSVFRFGGAMGIT